MSETLDLGLAVDLSAIMHKKDEEKATQLPKPAGYKILCAIPEIEDKFDNGLIKADVTMHHEELLTTVLFVIKMG